MPKVEITGRANLSGVLPVVKHTSESSKWGNWRVKPVSVEKQMAVMDSSSRAGSENTNTQKSRKVSLDSGIGSIGSIDSVGALDISRKDAEKIGKELERINLGLFAGGAQVKNLPKVRQALERKVCEALFDTLATYGLRRYAEGLVESGTNILDWCAKTSTPEVPKDLIKKSKYIDKLRAESNKLTQKVNLKDTPANVKKAIRKNEELTQFKRNQLEPARREFDITLYSLIDQHPSTQELKSCLQSIKALLPESVEVCAPIDGTIRTWAFNVLLERAKAAAGIS